MQEKGKTLINRAIKRKNLTGLDKSCDYLPCHAGLEDCTFCYCPFYPCNETDTGGFEKIRSNTAKPIWSCSNCLFIHRVKNSELILKGLVSYKKKIEDISREELLKLRSKILETNKK